MILSKLVFWMVIIFFVSASTNLLGWDLISDWAAGIGIYIPSPITGLVIGLAGFLLGNVVRGMITGAAISGSLDHAAELGRIVQLVILFTALVIGVEQIGLDVSFRTDIPAIVVGVLCAGAALAFDLGARNLVANIVGAKYLRRHCRIGESMQIGDVQGNIIDISHTTVILDTEQGRTVIPAKLFQEQVSSFATAIETSPDANRSPNPTGTKNG